MTSILRFVQVFALGTWVGSIIYFIAAVAPAAFGVLASRDEAGAVVGYALTRLHHLGVIAAVVYLLATLTLAKSAKGLWQPAALLVILMLVLTAVSQHGVRPRMSALKTQMGSDESTARDNPLRVKFDELHAISVKLEGAVLLIGIGALFLTVRNRPPL
ncbi:MAG: DUF4149 domain-containing protein [Candidatus Dormibacteria bacterium]